jgi:hypothetical protein
MNNHAGERYLPPLAPIDAAGCDSALVAFPVGCGQPVTVGRDAGLASLRPSEINDHLFFKSAQGQTAKTTAPDEHDFFAGRVKYG